MKRTDDPTVELIYSLTDEQLRRMLCYLSGYDAEAFDRAYEQVTKDR